MIQDHRTWIADNGDGTYTNPILYTDYSDPDACRVGDDYFMVASSFCNAPGLPVLHSRDLVNWRVISYALETIPGSQFDVPLHGKGVWAPAIRYHEGEFIIFSPCRMKVSMSLKRKIPGADGMSLHAFIRGKAGLIPALSGMRMAGHIWFLLSQKQDWVQEYSEPVRDYTGLLTYDR